MQKSRELKNDFDNVMKLYNDKLEEQRKFRERTQKANETVTNLKLSLTTKLSDVESKLKFIVNVQCLSVRFSSESCKYFQ